MKIVITSLFVDDQAKAQSFYHYVLGFEPKQDVPMGQHRWLTFTSPNDPHGVELLLEPNVHPAAKAYQAAIKADGIAAASFEVRDIQAEYERLCKAGVEFTTPPSECGPMTVAVFDDTCGNLIRIAQRH
ncbi:VOC family protein [Pseudomonas cremoricolorata]|uniref:VOC family protein n=1 Tax=Pseudomonas cremoricolorata TaxID=157783 RepID=UPI0003F5E05E|nr:VOC family protein [Pseudomonas cremoricolorata]